MMKRYLLALGLLLFAAPALATCPATLQVKDNAGTTVNVVYNDNGSGACIPSIQGTVNAVQSGTWNVGLTGTLPGFAATPTFNLGTLNGASTAANQATEIASLAQIVTNTGAVIPTQAPTVSIGGVGIIDSGGTNVATVKAASTSAVATDKSLVVQINPQQTPAVNLSQVNGGSALAVGCTNHAFKHITSATDTLAVQGVTSQTIRLCAWKARAAGTATWFWENTASINANCSSTLTQISGVATEAANTGEVVSLPLGVTLSNTSGNGLCINSTGTGGVDIDYWYSQG